MRFFKEPGRISGRRELLQIKSNDATGEEREMENGSLKIE
jgi:hypothetical protein